MSFGPHQMNIGWRGLSRMRNVVRKLCGQFSGGPSGLADQSYARVNAPISPPPARKSAEVGRLIFNIQTIAQSSPNEPPELSRLSHLRQTHGAGIWLQINFFDVRTEWPRASAGPALPISAETSRACGTNERRKPGYFMRPAAVSARVMT